MNRTAGRRRGRWVEADRLDQLEQLAQDGIRVRQAIEEMVHRRYQVMELVREGTAGTVDVEQGRGWLRCLDDLGELLIKEGDDS